MWICINTSMKDETIYSDLLVTCNAHSLYQLFLVADCCERGHEPTVAIIALSHIVGGCAFNKELWIFEDVLFMMSAARLLLRLCTVSLPRLS